MGSKRPVTAHIDIAQKWGGHFFSVKICQNAALFYALLPLQMKLVPVTLCETGSQNDFVKRLVI